jgi:hypothetical protein
LVIDFKILKLIFRKKPKEKKFTENIKNNFTAENDNEKPKHLVSGNDFLAQPKFEHKGEEQNKNINIVQIQREKAQKEVEAGLAALKTESAPEQRIEEKTNLPKIEIPRPQKLEPNAAEIKPDTKPDVKPEIKYEISQREINKVISSSPIHNLYRDDAKPSEKPAITPQETKKTETPKTTFGDFFKGKGTKSVFDVKKDLKKVYIKEQYKYAARGDRFTKQDSDAMQKLVLNSKYSQDGLISKSELEKVVNLDLTPAINKHIDPLTKKSLNPNNYKDNLRLQDLKEMKKDIKQMINRK